MPATQSSKTTTGSFFLVSALANGREVFLGRAIDEPFQEQLTLEGKSLSFTPQGYLVVRPFATIVTFPLQDPNHPVQNVTDPEVTREVTDVLDMSVIQIHRSTHPLVYRWVEACAKRDVTAAWHVNGFNRGGLGVANPIFSFYEGFMSSAEQFRRALFQSPQVNTTSELDSLTELEGQLTVKIGKVTNKIAINFNQVVTRESELTQYLEAIQGFSLPVPPASQAGGWVFLINWLQIAKNFAQREGKTPLVREINGLATDGINTLNAIILEHCSELDTLITEAFSKYGIRFEIYGAMSPFATYSTPFSGSVESYQMPHPVSMPVTAEASS